MCEIVPYSTKSLHNPRIHFFTYGSFPSSRAALAAWRSISKVDSSVDH
ncbi:hypothetical protein [Helicobacter canis]|nr:hypothetical protein [Helicobacter canis]